MMLEPVTDYASLMAGCTLEEILEPVVPLEGGGGRIGQKERNLVVVAMRVSRRCQSNSGCYALLTLILTLTP